MILFVDKRLICNKHAKENGRERGGKQKETNYNLNEENEEVEREIKANGQIHPSKKRSKIQLTGKHTGHPRPAADPRHQSRSSGHLSNGCWRTWLGRSQTAHSRRQQRPLEWLAEELWQVERPLASSGSPRK